MSNETALDPTTPGLSQVARVIDTFIAPSKTFQDIRRSGAWWMPFLIMLIFAAGTTVVIDRQVGFDRVYENATAHLPAFVQDAMNKMSPEQRAAAVQRGVVQQRITSYCVPVILLIVFAIYALLVWASFNFGLGVQLDYNRVLAVAWYASLPYVLRSILTIITLMFGVNTESFDPKNPIGTNLAYYMPDAAGWLKGFLMSFDMIAIWSLVLMVLGMAILSKKSVTQSSVVVGIFWLLGVLIQTIGGAFSG